MCIFLLNYSVLFCGPATFKNETSFVFPPNLRKDICTRKGLSALPPPTPKTPVKQFASQLI